MKEENERCITNILSLVHTRMRQHAPSKIKSDKKEEMFINKQTISIGLLSGQNRNNLKVVVPVRSLL